MSPQRPCSVGTGQHQVVQGLGDADHKAREGREGEVMLGHESEKAVGLRPEGFQQFN